jgi:hypothetical protein
MTVRPWARFGFVVLAALGGGLVGSLVNSHLNTWLAAALGGLGAALAGNLFDIVWG